MVKSYLLLHVILFIFILNGVNSESCYLAPRTLNAFITSNDKQYNPFDYTPQNGWEKTVTGSTNIVGNPQIRCNEKIITFQDNIYKVGLKKDEGWRLEFKLYANINFQLNKSTFYNDVMIVNAYLRTNRIQERLLFNFDGNNLYLAFRPVTAEYTHTSSGLTRAEFDFYPFPKDSIGHIYCYRDIFCFPEDTKDYARSIWNQIPFGKENITFHSGDVNWEFPNLKDSFSSFAEFYEFYSLYVHMHEEGHAQFSGSKTYQDVIKGRSFDESYLIEEIAASLFGMSRVMGVNASEYDENVLTLNTLSENKSFKWGNYTYTPGEFRKKILFCFAANLFLHNDSPDSLLIKNMSIPFNLFSDTDFGIRLSLARKNLDILIQWFLEPEQVGIFYSKEGDKRGEWADAIVRIMTEQKEKMIKNDIMSEKQIKTVREQLRDFDSCLSDYFTLEEWGLASKYGISALERLSSQRNEVEELDKTLPFFLKEVLTLSVYDIDPASSVIQKVFKDSLGFSKQTGIMTDFLLKIKKRFELKPETSADLSIFNQHIIRSNEELRVAIEKIKAICPVESLVPLMKIYYYAIFGKKCDESQLKAIPGLISAGTKRINQSDLLHAALGDLEMSRYDKLAKSIAEAINTTHIELDDRVSLNNISVRFEEGRIICSFNKGQNFEKIKDIGVYKYMLNVLFLESEELLKKWFTGRHEFTFIIPASYQWLKSEHGMSV